MNPLPFIPPFFGESFDYIYGVTVFFVVVVVVVVDLYFYRESESDPREYYTTGTSGVGQGRTTRWECGGSSTPATTLEIVCKQPRWWHSAPKWPVGSGHACVGRGG